MKNAAKVNAGKNSAFATRLRQLMEAKKVTQQALADVVGVTRQAISWYMDGASSPNVDALHKICEYFDVSADYLIGRTDTMTKNPNIAQVCNKLGLSRNAVLLLAESYKDKKMEFNDFKLLPFNEFVNLFADIEFENKDAACGCLFHKIMKFFKYERFAKDGSRNTRISALRHEKENLRTMGYLTEEDLLDLYLMQIKRGLLEYKKKIDAEGYLEDRGIAFRTKLFTDELSTDEENEAFLSEIFDDAGEKI